jgi:5-methylcytosine-specific restriction endonuclease McrA
MPVKSSTVCKKCKGTDFGYWTSLSTGKINRYCRNCRKKRADIYSARKNVNGGSHTRKEWEEKLSHYQKCPRCGRYWEDIPDRPNKRYKYKWTIDHIIPITMGGTDNIDNIQPLCYQCNSSKCNRT